MFQGLPLGTAEVLYVDPPWKFALRSDKGDGRSADQHYDCMTLDEIKAMPVASLAAKDCTLLMWVTDPMLQHGMDVLKAWGFEYKTVGFCWVKLNKDGTPFTGMGYWTRANQELCLLATRGSPKRYEKSVKRVVMSPRREHSRKPDEMYGYIDRLLGEDTVKMELFARGPRPGYWSWGMEVNRFDTQ